MKTKEINAVTLLKQVTSVRYWHQGKIERRAAAQLKRNLNTNQVSYEKAVEILQLLGYQKIQEETWQAP